MSFKGKLKKNKHVVYIFKKIQNFYLKNVITEEKIIRKRFEKRVGRKLELQNPVFYNDKLQWLKLNWKNPLATQCADKYEVREFVEERIGARYLNEIYGVYDSVKEIDIDKLPDSFVLKGTHGSGFNIVCKDKNMMNWVKEFKKMELWMKTNYYLQNREWVYKDIKPRIICEKYLEQEESIELRDYRFFCFNGKPKFITVDFSINDKENTRRNLFDLNWNRIEGEISYPEEVNINVEKPVKLLEMINLSQRLSNGFPHARIDFYYIEERIIFGEITFFHQSGMANIKPVELEARMGGWLSLDSIV